MKDWEINFKPNGVSIKVNKTRSLRDPDTGGVVDVPLGAHRCAVSVGDFETPELFRAHIQGLMGAQYSTTIAAVASESVIMKEGIAAAELAKADAEARRAIAEQSLEVSEEALVAANGRVQARAEEIQAMRLAQEVALDKRGVALEAVNTVAAERLALNSSLTRENSDLKTKVSDLEAVVAKAGKKGAVETKGKVE